MYHNKICMVRVWFGKSYLKPYTEHSIDIINTRLKGQTTKLRNKGFDVIHYENLETDH